VSFKSINRQPVKDAEASQRYNPNRFDLSFFVMFLIKIVFLKTLFFVQRFNLQFVRETPEELKKHKKNASKPLELKGESELEIEIEDVYKPDFNLDIPIRPAWSYGMSKEQVDRQEREYFSVFKLFFL